jgi:urea carboxylase
LKSFEAGAETTDTVISTRVIEVPVFYDDPWTRETLMRFRERHQEPGGTDLDYAARINGFGDVEAFIEAHSGAPWFVSMVGFVAGLPFMYQMVDRKRQIEVPKYLRPRTDTPRLTVGHGGCFGCIYSVRGAGGYQMFGITPMPIYDPAQTVSYLRDFMILFRPGDIVQFRRVDREGYDAAVEAVDGGRFEPVIRKVRFSLADFLADPDGTNASLLKVLP